MAKNQGGERICEVALNILNCLFDLDVVEKKRTNATVSAETPEKKAEDEQSVTTDSGKGEITAFDLAMDSLIR